VQSEPGSANGHRVGPGTPGRQTPRAAGRRTDRAGESHGRERIHYRQGVAFRQSRKERASAARLPAPIVGSGGQASSALTLAETAAMSALPASFGLTIAITLPIPAGPAAPVEATASAIIASISASDACAGR
jgi:hypothetical protein